MFGMECYVCIQKQFWKKFNKIVFGRMIDYLNNKDGYQGYVPYLLHKTVHSHDVYFKPERVGTSSVIETGLKNAAWKM